MSVTAVDSRSVPALQDALAAHRSAVVPARRDRTQRSETATHAVILGAHPWAGTSTVAVALADAVARLDPHSPLRLIDAAPLETSGTVSATDRELGVGQDGWRRGRRGAVEVWRLERALQEPDGVPPLAPTGRVLLDAGRQLQDLPAGPGWISPFLSSARLVVIARATIPGVRRAEQCLREVGGDDAVLALVGSRRVPRVVEASMGPRVRRANDAGQVIAVPHDNRLAVEGVDDSPMPKPVAVAATELARRVWPALVGDDKASRKGSR